MPSLLSAQRTSTPLADEMQTIVEGMRRVPVTEHRLDRARYRPEALELVASQWRMRMAFEHRSSMVFGQLAAQLFEANAPLDTKVVMMRMAQDELRHTETCAQVIEALDPGTPAIVEADLTIESLALHGNASPFERALRNVLYTTCMSEMVACARFVATLDRTTDPFMRDAMRALLADEVLHAQFGFFYLAHVRAELDAKPELRASIERYLVHAFAVIEGELAPKPPFVAPDADVMALGGDDLALAREVFYGTMEGAVVPGFEQQGLDAGTSWKQRRRLA